MSEAIENSNQYILFDLANELYAVDIDEINVIEQMLPITRVPKSENYILGVINLRGEIIPVVDIRIKFNMLVKEVTNETRIMIFKSNNVNIGILVDKVEQVEEIPSFRTENAKNIIGDINEDSIVGIAKVGNRVVTILNASKLLEDTH
jgi:purine-binding chemotaxis protein CheW